MRRGRGEPVSITRGVGDAGSGVNTVVGETCGAAESNGAGLLTAERGGNAIDSVFERVSNATCVAPRHRASGASSSSAGSLFASGLARAAALAAQGDERAVGRALDAVRDARGDQGRRDHAARAQHGGRSARHERAVDHDGDGGGEHGRVNPCHG